VDGTSGEFDTIIAATGYRIGFDFIGEDVISVEDNTMDLYLRMVRPGWPGLFFMGFFNTDTALNLVFEHQARWVREILLGNAVLPDDAAMRQAIVDRTAWYAARYKHTSRHTIEEEHIRYLTDLKKTMHAMIGAAGKAVA
jgi:dimethylaniline monooxygenase (N-oxide forming)